MTEIVVVAVGGNSLITDNIKQSVADQFVAARETALHIASLVAQGWQVAITHGNGPQVGFVLLQSEAARDLAPPVPLDYAGAQTQGGIGYTLQQTLGDELRRRNMARGVVSLVTQVVVEREDPAFQHPTKPIGPFYSEPEAKAHEKDQGWHIVEDAGRGWRRVVPSPRPREIVEVEMIRDLLSEGYVVIAVGGGGVPVVRDKDGYLHGVEAVIDKDYASSLLAAQLSADLFLISTAVQNVYLDYGKPTARPLDRMSLTEAKRYLAEGHFPAGSMGPKIQAVIQYLEAGGKEALITSPENLERALRGETGTRIASR